MSDLMLHGKLNMPLPNDPRYCDVVTWVQFKAAAKEASARIEELEAKMAIYGDALKHIAQHDTQMRAIKALSDANGGKDE